MGYYLPNRSYLKPKQTTALRTQILFFTAAISIIAVIVIFTTIQLMTNYGAEAKNVNKGAKDISLMGTEKFIPVIQNTGNIDFPAQLAFFIVEANEYTVEIKWATVSEYKNAYFILERSYDNSDFSEVTRIEGHGTTKQSNDYSYIDDSLKTNFAFYRLKQVSENGNSSFIALDKAEKPAAKRDEDLYVENNGPESFDKGFNINYYSEIEGGVSVELIDSNGNEIFKAYTNAIRGYNTCRFENKEKLKDNQYTLRIANSSAVYTTKIRRKSI
jgi:hypothetical protein